MEKQQMLKGGMKKNMKKTIVSMAMFALLMVSMFSFVSAATEVDTETTIDGFETAKPVQPKGGFAHFFGRIGEFFDSQDEKMRKAEARAEGLQAYIDDPDSDPNRVDTAKKRLADLEGRIDEGYERLSNAQDRTVEQIEKALVRVEQTLIRLDERMLRNDAKCLDVSIRAGEAGKDDEFIASVDLRCEKHENDLKDKYNKLTRIKEALMTKYKALTGMTDEEIAKKISELAGDSTTDKESRVEKTQRIADKFADVRGDQIVKLQERIDSGDLTEEQIAKAKDRIAHLEAATDKMVANLEAKLAQPGFRFDASFKAKVMARADMLRDRHAEMKDKRGGAGFRDDDVPGDGEGRDPDAAGGLGDKPYGGEGICLPLGDGEQCVEYQQLELCLKQAAKDRCGAAGFDKVLCKDNPDHPRCIPFGKTHATCSDDPNGWPIGFFECRAKGPAGAAPDAAPI